MLKLLPLLLVNGVVFGSMYALNAIGFGIMYNTTNIINFTQGEFVMLGGMLTYVLYAHGHLPIVLAALGAIAATTAIGCAIERFTIRPLWRRQAKDWTYIFMLFAVATVIPNLVMLLISRDPQGLPAFTGTEPLSLGLVRINPQALWVVGVTAVLAIGLHGFFNYTLVGKAMKATAVNRRAAAWMGIPVERMVALSFALSALLGAVAGVVFTPLISTQFDAGLAFTLKGFAAAIIGGLGNIKGAIFGGLTLGILEALSTAFVSSLYGDAITYGILFSILAVRPTGFFRPLVELRQEEI
jgi:branched-chain amino acid transport system permease protein